jgi:UDP-N-acetylmuramoyl-tripeptide--D-alanyl-D-alanine ligase
MKFTPEQIASATGGALHDMGRGAHAAPRNAPGASPALQIVTDSRKAGPETCFVALVGERFDAHDFVAQVAQAGAALVVTSRPPEGCAVPCVEVPDTLVALQDLGRAVRRAFSGPVVGITGSAGKTTTRVLVVEVLRALGPVHHTQGNLNNHVGVPLTLLAYDDTLPAAAMVLEMGMNHLGEIAVLQDIGAPTIRLVTNVGEAHVEGCGSIEGVARAKQEMFDGARPGDVCIVNLDNAFVAAMPLPAGARRLTYGVHPDADVRMVEARIDGEALTTHLVLDVAGTRVTAMLAVPGLHIAHNAAAAAAVALAAGVPLGSLGEALSRYAPEGMRNRVEHLHGLRVIDDAYNANPTSMEAALRLLAALPGPRVAVLGDMLELGAAEADAHRAVLSLAVSLGLEGVHVTGPRMTAAARDLDGHLIVHADVDALADALLPHLAPASALLVKGSRGARMERVTARLRGGTP